jgi:PPP family 3-phenylpropionic acid transporter
LFRAEGGTIAGIGLAFLLMAGSEAPFMALTPILSKKLGAEKVILASMIIAVARFAFYSTGPSYWWLLGSFFLQGMTNGIILVELVKYFSRVVEPKMAGLAMAVYYAIGSSLSAILCNLIGGMVLDWKGPCGVYGFFALYNGLAVVLYISMKLYKPHKQKI